jgi:hypothetical protein
LHISTKAFGIKHFICKDVPLLCDECQKAIEGPCIQCIHCPSYQICLQCNATKVYEKNKKSSSAIMGGVAHNSSHVCKVMLNPVAIEADDTISTPNVIVL